ncbi:MAG: type II secretion system F family protein [Nocardioidaceae bacterium]
MSIAAGVAVLLAAAAAAALPARRYRPAVPASAGRPARRADTPRLRVLLSVGAAAAGLLLVGGVAGMVVGAGVGVLCWRATAGLEPPAVRRRRERLEADLPLVVDLMASAMAAGAAPSAAVAAVVSAVDGPTAEELAALHARLVLGADPVTAWRDLGADPQLGPLGRCVARAVESGASLADALHRLAEDLRASRRAEVEGRARSVGVKAAAPLGLCLLPAFVLTGVVPLVAASVRLFTGR